MGDKVICARSGVITWRQGIHSATVDLLNGIVEWRPWYTLGLAEVKQRYRRSSLGPLWVTISMATQVFVMGYLLSHLFNQPSNKYLPYISISLIIWSLFSSIVTEGSMVFNSMSGVILQVRRPYFSYVMLIIWKNILVSLHTIPIFFIVFLGYHFFPDKNYWLLIPGLMLLLLNASWIALLLGIVSARYHDIPPTISNLMSILVWLTPIYYQTEQLSDKAKFLIYLNPLTSVIQVSRDTFLNMPPNLSVWLVASFTALLGWSITIFVFARVKQKISIWI